MSEIKKCKLMILCWGYSIHAVRRAQLFIDDPRFDVTVVSTYDYSLPGADNVLLGTKKSITTAKEVSKPSGKSFKNSIPIPIRNFLKTLTKIFGLIFEIKSMDRDYKILRQEVESKNPDVLLLQTLQYPSFLAYRLPRDLPMVVTFWNGDLTYFAKWTGLEIFMKKRLVVHGLKRVNAITVNSQTAFDAGVKLGADPDKITLVRYPGADLDIFYPREKLVARKRLGITAKHVLICPRGLGKFFNSDIIIEAAAIVAKKYPDLLVLFISGVGGEEEWEKHVKLAKSLNIESKIRWDGHIDWKDMPWYYSAADVMVSVKTEDSCPNCMLESMACGIPVVMSDTSQNREWIKDGENGFLCQPEDSPLIAERIVSLLINEDDIVPKFSSISLNKVQKDANSNINIARIRELVNSFST